MAWTTTNKGSEAHCIMWLLQQSSVNCLVHNLMPSHQAVNNVPNTYTVLDISRDGRGDESVEKSEMVLLAQ